MRLDKFLKVSRIIKRRTVANEVCDASRASVNGRPAKASKELKAGDIVELAIGEGSVRFKVLSLEEKTGKDFAKEMYEILAD
ncbi:MAG: RNA-binding S4 domain-containing protein [Oscillospiraceae bacterium]|nr:RNA-binding S4 domain-containing protein [Oscillospiraceae bacterium]